MIFDVVEIRGSKVRPVKVGRYPFPCGQGGLPRAPCCCCCSSSSSSCGRASVVLISAYFFSVCVMQKQTSLSQVVSGAVTWDEQLALYVLRRVLK